MSSDDTLDSGESVTDSGNSDAPSAANHPTAVCDVPQRLHPSSIFFDLASHGRQFLVPALFAFLGATGGNWFWGVAAIIGFLAAILSTLFRYFTLRYLVKDGELLVHEGLIFRKERTVPIRRIQNMDLQQNLLHRFFGVAEVRIETASGSEAEAVLRVLTRAQIESLREAIFPDTDPGQLENELKGTEPGDAADKPVSTDFDKPVSVRGRDRQANEILQVPIRWLMMAGLASNRGLLLVGIVIGAFFQFDIDERFRVREFLKAVQKWLPEWGEVTSNWLFWTAVVLGVFLVLKLLGICWFILRFHGYRLDRVGNDLRVTGGLFTSYSASIPRQRIQFISVHRPLVLRWWGMATIRIETAGGATSGQENEQANIARSWFVPVVPHGEIPRILSEMRPGLNWNESAFAWNSPSPQTWKRLLRFGILSSVVIGATGWFTYPPWGFLAGVVLLPVSIWLAKRKSRSLSYARTEFGIVFRSGILYRKLGLTFFDRIQAIRLNQSPFDRRWKMASLAVDTAAAGPAEHVIDVPFLDENLARAEFARLQSDAASHRPVWG